MTGKLTFGAPEKGWPSFGPDGKVVSSESHRCPWPDGDCTCSNGIGCANVPVAEW